MNTFGNVFYYYYFISFLLTPPKTSPFSLYLSRSLSLSLCLCLTLSLSRSLALSRPHSLGSPPSLAWQGLMIGSVRCLPIG